MQFHRDRKVKRNFELCEQKLMEIQGSQHHFNQSIYVAKISEHLQMNGANNENERHLTKLKRKSLEQQQQA